MKFLQALGASFDHNSISISPHVVIRSTCSKYPQKINQQKSSHSRKHQGREQDVLISEQVTREVKNLANLEETSTKTRK